MILILINLGGDFIPPPMIKSFISLDTDFQVWCSYAACLFQNVLSKIFSAADIFSSAADAQVLTADLLYIEHFRSISAVLFSTFWGSL